ncbi:HlyD family secretion protein [Brevibacillus migulae]|uniref:HlyD family secretion protein n=1 Tax=Brevibacillus migulae TaxID=1644114 RepID=UPI00106E47DF|nr:efflux RND transporter periplasmic adaptor subunit [Brevibacillus migulae]
MRKRWWWIGGALVTVVVGTGLFLSLGSGQPAGVQVTMAAVTQGDLSNEVLTSGKAKVEEEIKLYANGNGILREFTIKEGMTVRKGQPIGKIDTSDVESKILELEAQIDLQHANLAKLHSGEEPEEIAQQQERIKQEQLSVQAAQKELQRIEQLYASGAVTAQEWEKAKDALATAQSNLNVAKQQLVLKQKGPRKEEVQSIQAQITQLQVEKAQWEKERRESVLLAPENGTILAIAANNGQHVTKGTEILTLGNLNDIIVEAEVNESDVHKIAVGHEAVISGSSLGKDSLKAKVTSIAPIAVTTQNSSGQGEQTRVKVTLSLLEHAETLKPGYHVDINIITEKFANALQVPIEAIQQEPDGTPYVWIAENGLAKKQKVKIGIENELFTQIIEGVKPGQEIITNPPEHLKESDPVVNAPAGMPMMM